MTGFSDNIYSGLLAPTSAGASYSPVELARTIRFSGGSGTQTIVFPTGVQNVNANLYILANGSAATTNKITVSAGGTNILTFSSFGSTSGFVEVTTAALGTKSVIASAAANLSTTAEVTAAVTYLSTDAAVDCQIKIEFTRLRTDPLGNT